MPEVRSLRLEVFKCPPLITQLCHRSAKTSDFKLRTSFFTKYATKLAVGPYLLVLAFLTIPLLGFSQNLRKIKEVSVEEPRAVSMDRNGSIFVAHKRGRISRISEDGEVTLNYSPEKNGRVSLLEAWTTLDLLVFYEGLQSLTLLNRFLSPISTIDLSDHIGYARLATYNYESNIWVIDDSDFSLKLFNISLGKVTVNTPLNLILDHDNYETTFIREYQNLLFISDLNTGILIFDNLGNYLRTLSTKNVSFFGFVENEIYYKSGNELIFMDIYSGQETRIAVPTAKYYLASTNKLYLFSNDRMSIYSY